jgi:hypothetical protein
MTANELANELEKITDLRWYASEILRKEVINMLRQQAQEIADLKIANQDLKYQLIQKSGEVVLADFDIKELEKEIEHLKSKVQYWKARVER